MLASLLPGLRDLRAPLAAGYLWLAAGWLYFAPQLPDSITEAQGVLKDIYRVAAASSPVALAAGLTFSAYMVGILSTGLLTRPTRVLLRASCIALLAITAPFVIAVGLLGMSWTWLGDRLNKIEDLIRDLVARHYASPANRARDLVVRRMSNNLLYDEAYRKTLLDGLNKTNANSAAQRMSGRGPRTVRRIGRITPTRQLRVPVDAGRYVNEIRDSLLAGIEMGSRRAADILVLSVVDVERHVREILDELKLVPERIVGDRPETYERWDRLSAESDFRQAVVPPLIGILAVLILRGAPNWPFWLIAITVPVVILVQGIGKEHAAEGQLMQTLEAGVIKAEPIEKPTTNNLYFKQSNASLK